MASAKKKQKRVLFFLKGSNPTEAEQKAAEKIDGNVLFRNGSMVGESDALEPVDAVSGYASHRYDGVAVYVGDKGERPHAPEKAAKSKSKNKSKSKEEEEIL